MGSGRLLDSVDIAPSQRRHGSERLCARSGLDLVVLMLSDAPALHDPELSMDIRAREGGDERSQRSFEFLEGHASRRAKDHDPRP